MIQPAVARHVVVDAEDVRQLGVVTQAAHVATHGLDAVHVLPQPMVAVEAACEQVERQPAACVVELDLVPKRGCAVRLAAILVDDQQGVRSNSSDLTHRVPNSDALGDCELDEHLATRGVRWPPTVQTGESRGRQWLIYRKVRVNLWKAPGDVSGVSR